MSDIAILAVGIGLSVQGAACYWLLERIAKALEKLAKASEEPR